MAVVMAVVMPVWVVPVRLAAEEGDDNKDNGKGSNKGSSDDNNHRNSMDMDSTGMCNNMDGVADGIAY